jgi:hypothetical protein
VLKPGGSFLFQVVEPAVEEADEPPEDDTFEMPSITGRGVSSAGWKRSVSSGSPAGAA